MRHDMSTEDLQRELQSIRGMLDAMNDEERAHKEAFTNLYKQLESYKSNFAQKLKNQLLREMLTYFDSLLWYQSMIEEQLNSLQPQDTSSEVDVLENTQYLVEEFVEILRRNEVIAMPETPQFDGKYHRAVQVLESNNEDDEGKIAKIIRKGFYLGTQILRIEDVVVYRYIPIKEEFIENPEPQEDINEDINEEDSSEEEEQVSLNIQLPIQQEVQDISNDVETSEE